MCLYIDIKNPKCVQSSFCQGPKYFSSKKMTPIILFTPSCIVHNSNIYLLHLLLLFLVHVCTYVFYAFSHLLSEYNIRALSPPIVRSLALRKFPRLTVIAFILSILRYFLKVRNFLRKLELLRSSFLFFSS